MSHPSLAYFRFFHTFSFPALPCSFNLGKHKAKEIYLHKKNTGRISYHRLILIRLSIHLLMISIVAWISPIWCYVFIQWRSTYGWNASNKRERKNNDNNSVQTQMTPQTLWFLFIFLSKLHFHLLERNRCKQIMSSQQSKAWMKS